MDHEEVVEVRQQLMAMFPVKKRDSETLPQVFFHVGPTNSGKTYKAIQKLLSSRKGIYLAPLRLLAWEMYEKINKVSPCTLLTGEEVIAQPGASFISATVEMFPSDDYWDVIVLDESQMAADPERGWAWTRVMSSANAREIHICCIPEIQEFLQKFLQQIGYTKITAYFYERLTPLKVSTETWTINNPPTHTIFVVFKRLEALDLKNYFEKQQIPTSIIYGSLPPQVRRRETEKFISGETDLCVATDAIGMGMNLPAQNVCFVKWQKFDGYKVRDLDVIELRQIAGRAGRFGFHEIGYVGSTCSDILMNIQNLLDAPFTWERKLRITPSLAELNQLEGTFFEKIRRWQRLQAIPQEYKKFIVPCDMQQRLGLALEITNEHREILGDKICFAFINAPISKGIEAYWLLCLENITKYSSLPLPRKPLESKSLLLENLYEWEQYVQKLDVFLWFYHRDCIIQRLHYSQDDLDFAKESRDAGIERINFLLYEISQRRTRR